MTTDFRALCAELLDCLEKADWPHKQKHVFEQWVYIARKALAEPELEGPTDEEIMELMPQQMRDDLAAAARALAVLLDNIKAASVFRIILNRHSVDHARAVLARWGRTAPQLADGEVAELVAWLRMYGSTGRQVLDQTPWTASQLDRAADLLERLSPPQPVPVSERLPGPELCWWYEPDEDDGYGGSWTLLRIRGGTSTHTHWLPAHALPLPE